MVNVCGFASLRVSVSNYCGICSAKAAWNPKSRFIWLWNTYSSLRLLKETALYATFPDHDKWKKLLPLCVLPYSVQLFLRAPLKTWLHPLASYLWKAIQAEGTVSAVFRHVLGCLLHWLAGSGVEGGRCWYSGEKCREGVHHSVRRWPGRFLK